MNEDNFETQVTEEDEAILPDGWTEDDDFFDPDSWGSEEKTEEPKEPEDDTDEGGDAGESETPTTEHEDPDGEKPAEDPGENTEGREAPTTEPTEPEEAAGKRKLRIKARVDHEDQDVEIDESDLPEIYQKSTVTDRYQAKLAKVTPTLERLDRLAKANGYENVEAMLDAQESYDREQAVAKLMDEGAPKTLAEDYVDRQFGGAPQKQISAAPESEPASVKVGAPERDLASEISELWTMRPELRGKTIPSEVAAAAAKGQSLVIAYLDYENKQSKAAAENYRKENEVYKQNAASAAKAPVKGVSGGGSTDTQPEDMLLKGFDAAW